MYALTQRWRVFKKLLFIFAVFRSHSGFFDVPSCAGLPASVMSAPGTALPKDKLESEVVVAGTQVEQEEQVTGDTPPGHLGCAVPMVENDLLRPRW